MQRLTNGLIFTALAVLLAGLALAGCINEHPAKKQTEELAKETELNKYEAFLSNNPEASESFTEDQYKLALELLEREPEVMNDPEFHEGFNATIKAEDNLLDRLKIDNPSEADWQEIITPIWSDIYDRIYKGENNKFHRTIEIDGKEYSVISKTALSQRLPHEEDREFYYMGLAVPRHFESYSPSPDWGEWLSMSRAQAKHHRERLKKVPYQDWDTIPYGRASVVENLNNMPKLASLTMQAYISQGLYLHQRARQLWEVIKDDEFPASLTAYKKYVDLYKERGDEEIELALFVHGLVNTLYHGDKVNVDAILLKSLGVHVVDQRAPTNHGMIDPVAGLLQSHGEPALFIPKYILDEIKANSKKYGTPLIGPGQTIGWISNYEVTDKLGDNIPFVEFKMPNKITIIKLDNKYDLTKRIELYRENGIDPEVLERNNLK